MKKEEREWATLRLVYNVDQFASVVHQDKPDFVLCRGGPTSFGVEVTELYQTGSDARLRQHPDYATDLLAGGEHMHRDDVSTLEVTTVDILDSDGELKTKDVPAIMRPTPSPQEHAAALAEVVRRKSQKAHDYVGNLSHTNLVVLDRFDLGRELEDEYSTRDLFAPELRQALLDTTFSEVFLVRQHRDGHHDYRPLQLLLLLESFYLFLGALDSSDLDESRLELHDVVPLFLMAMDGTGMRLALATTGDDDHSAWYRRVGVRHTGKGIEILDGHDFEPPTPIPLPPVPLSPTAVAAFAAHHAKFVEENSFVTELAMREPLPAATDR